MNSNTSSAICLVGKRIHFMIMWTDIQIDSDWPWLGHVPLSEVTVVTRGVPGAGWSVWIITIGSEAVVPWQTGPKNNVSFFKKGLFVSIANFFGLHGPTATDFKMDPWLGDSWMFNSHLLQAGPHSSGFPWLSWCGSCRNHKDSWWGRQCAPKGNQNVVRRRQVGAW